MDPEAKGRQSWSGLDTDDRNSEKDAFGMDRYPARKG